MKDKFKMENGKLTRYAFACGYIERIDINDNNRGHICLEPNGYHVKGFQNGCHFWDIFNRVADARKRLNQLKGA